MSNKAEQRRAKRARAKARKKEKKSELLISEDARKKHVQKMGQEIITAKFVAGKGKSRHQGKQEDNIFKYITSEKAFRDVSATWRRFSEFVAKHSDGTDLNSLEDVLKYVDLYIMDLMLRGRKADTLTTYKANLGKVFGVSTTYFIETPKRERRNKTRSRLEVKIDHKISKEKNDFFDILGSATGLRKRELERLRGTDLIAKKAKNGLYYVNITRGTKGGRTRVSPIMAKSEAELEQILVMFKAAGTGVVCSGKYGTHRVPKNLDEHSRRAEYAKRVYLHYERDLDRLPRKEKTFLRKEYAGYVLDKFAEQKATEYLGHNRKDEFRKSYVYRLFE